MMKRVKIVSLTAVALLTIGPIVVSPMSVLAADIATTNTAMPIATDAVTAHYIHDGKAKPIDLNNQTLQVVANSIFNPTKITLTNGGIVKMSSSITVISNDVDTSKPEGLFQLNLSGSDYVKAVNFE